MATNIGSSIKTGIIAAFISGSVTLLFGTLLVTVFGLPAFAYGWAFALTAFGLFIISLHAYVFLPLTTILAAIISAWLTRRRFGRLIAGPYAFTVAVAFLLLSVVSIPVTIFITIQGERIKEEADTLQQAQTAVRTDVVKITDLSATASSTALTVQPELTGMLPGQYEARLTVSDRVPLVTRTTTVQLPQQTAALAWSIPFSELGQAYRQKILINQSARVHVESTFSVTVELELITPQDSAVTTLLPPQSPERSSDARSSIKLDIGQI